MNYKQIDYIQKDCHEALNDSVGALENLKNKQIFISGATGFVGKWILESINYLNANHSFNTNVIAYSNSALDSAKKLPHLFEKKEIKLIEGDIKSLSDIDLSTSYVLHLAASPDNRIHASDPVKAMTDMIFGTNKILDACIRLERLLNFTHFSSGYVYGHQPFSDENINEDSFHGFNCSSLSSFYAEGKRASESLVQAYRSQYKVPVTIFRPFAFIGPYQSLDRPWAINNFIRDGFYKQTIRILGDEDTVRSYMYPSEMAQWTLLAMANSSSANAYNLGSPDGQKLRNIAQVVERAFGGSLGISTSVPVNTLQKSRFVPSINKFEEQFNLKLKFNTEQAINKAIEWYRLGEE